MNFGTEWVVESGFLSESVESGKGVDFNSLRILCVFYILNFILKVLK